MSRISYFTYIITTWSWSSSNSLGSKTPLVDFPFGLASGLMLEVLVLILGGFFFLSCDLMNWHKSFVPSMSILFLLIYLFIYVFQTLDSKRELMPIASVGMNEGRFNLIIFASSYVNPEQVNWLDSNPSVNSRIGPTYGKIKCWNDERSNLRLLQWLSHLNLFQSELLGTLLSRRIIVTGLGTNLPKVIHMPNANVHYLHLPKPISEKTSISIFCGSYVHEGMTKVDTKH